MLTCKAQILSIFFLFLLQNSLDGQTMTFDTGPNYPGFTFSGWGSENGIIYPAEPNANGVARIAKETFCWNLVSFETRKFGNGGGYRITSNKGMSYTYYPNSQDSKVHTLNWEEIQWVEIVLFDLSTEGVNFTYDFDNVVFTVPVKTAAEMPTVTASQLEVCPGTSTTLNITGNLNSATTWKVYAGSCGQNFVASTEGNTVEVTPSAETTYFIRGEKDECTPIGECSQGIIITLKTESTALTSVTSDINPICEGEEFTLTASGGIDGDDATVKWYNGPGGTGENVANGLGPHTFTAQNTTTYYVRREGLCNNSEDNSITQNVDLCPCKDLGGDANGDSLCDGLGSPDVNVTVIDQEVVGDLSTNDDKISGASYGSLSTVPGHQNPDGAIPSLNSNGTYSFTGTSVGIYLFQIAVCPPDVTIGCPSSQLRMTVIEATDLQSGPIVNTDIAKVKSSNSSILTMPVLQNDAPGRPSGVLSLPTIIVGPLNADNSSVDGSGNIIYDPIDSYAGPDTITYQVCDISLNPQECASGQLIIEVLSPDALNSLSSSDDFTSVLSDLEASSRGSSSGNVLINDIDPDGDELRTEAQTVASPGGTFELDAMGNFTFTSTPNFIGSESFTYILNDNAGNTQSSTVYIQINTSSGVLPVSYLSFNAAWRDQIAELSWVVDSEVDNDYYSIERSEDGKTFYSVGKVVANHKQTFEERKYNFSDRNAANLNSPDIYYRLKQIDYNGQYSFSNVTTLRNAVTKSFYTIYPNPNGGDFSFEHLKEAKSVSIYNILGQIVFFKEVDDHTDLNFHFENMTPGTYSLVIIDRENRPHTQRLILQGY